MENQVIEHSVHAPVHQQVNAPSQVSGPEKLLELAISKDLDMEKLERLMAMQQRWEAQQSRKAYFKAFSEFQAECPPIPKDVKKTFPTSKGPKTLNYASLGQIGKIIRPVMKKHGLSYRWSQEQANGMMKITCILAHEMGHEESTSLIAPPDSNVGNNGLHQNSSTNTYLQRYTLKAVAGLSDIDDDDDGVSGGDNKAPVQQQQAQPQYYPDDKFQQNFASWSQLISSGKQSADTLIKMAASKGQPLSPNQIGALKSIKK